MLLRYYYMKTSGYVLLNMFRLGTWGKRVSGNKEPNGII